MNLNRKDFLKMFSILGFGLISYKSKSLINVLMLKKKAGGITASVTINSNTLRLDAKAALGNPASAGNFTITIDSGVYIYSDDTTYPAMDCSTIPSGSTLTIVNNGYIMGMGGVGGGNNGYTNVAAGAGGTAIKFTASTNVTIDSRTGYILGGGGGGDLVNSLTGGGGAGGGAGGAFNTNAGGSGGAPGLPGANGVFTGAANNATGGGGGRVVVGCVTTTGPSGTAGGAVGGLGGSGGGTGAAGYDVKSTPAAGIGGSGGGLGEVGGASNGALGSYGGGGYGAAGGGPTAGAAGKAIEVNSASITWTGGFGSNLVYGSVS